LGIPGRSYGLFGSLKKPPERKERFMPEVLLQHIELEWQFLKGETKMRIIIESKMDDSQTVNILKAIVKYYDGYCLPGTMEPKKYNLVNDELKSDVRGNISILFC
jgi:hypothetical protein